jgi:hypothetical protein
MGIDPYSLTHIKYCPDCLGKISWESAPESRSGMKSEQEFDQQLYGLNTSVTKITGDQYKKRTVNRVNVWLLSELTTLYISSERREGSGSG